jgi:hypothetical protein
MVKKPTAKRSPRVGVTYAEVVRFAVATLPGVEESPWYGTPGLKVGKKGFLRLREAGVVVIGVGTMLERDYLLDADPKAFYITDHYRDYPALLVRLSSIRSSVLFEMVADAWRRTAPRKLVAAFDSAEAAAAASPRTRAKKPGP